MASLTVLESGPSLAYDSGQNSQIEERDMRWQLQEAKNQLSRLVQLARQRGPQIITRHGKAEAVVVSVETWNNLAERRGSIGEFLRKSPLVDSGLSITRSTDAGRDVPL
ncbi:MAG: type II toxin-antitoxin system Phd/YefM family antitoxin [Gammaproteobacteria bacterium]